MSETFVGKPPPPLHTDVETDFFLILKLVFAEIYKYSIQTHNYLQKFEVLHALADQNSIFYGKEIFTP